MVCNSKEESRTAHNATRRYKSRRGLKGPRRPTESSGLLCFEKTPSTLQTTSAFLLSPPGTTFHTAREGAIYYDLLVEHNRLHTLSSAQTVALQPAARILFPIVAHDSPGGITQTFEMLWGPPLHTPLRLFSSWSPGLNFLMLKRFDE